MLLGSLSLGLRREGKTEDEVNRVEGWETQIEPTQDVIRVQLS